MFEFDYNTISNQYENIKKKEQEKFDLTIQAIDDEVTREMNSKITSGDFTKGQEDVDSNPYYIFEITINSLIPSKDNIRTPFSNCPTPLPINFNISREHMEYYKKNICAPKNCYMTFDFSDYKYHITLYFFSTEEDYKYYALTYQFD